MDNPTPPWERLAQLIQDKDAPRVIEFVNELSPSETARAISRLDGEDQMLLFSILTPEEAAEIIEDMPEVQAADLVEEMPSEEAAAILEELQSDHLVDLLGEMDDRSSQAVLSKMDIEDAREARMFLEYETDCAGGLMISEYLAYPMDQTIQDVLDDLQANRDAYADYHVLYFYVVDRENRLAGVLRMHDLLFPSRDTTLSTLMTPSPLSLPHKASLRELENFSTAII